MRYPLTLIAGIVAVIAMSLGAIVAAGKADENLRHILYAVILAMAAPTVTTLLSILRSEKNAEKLDQNTALTEQAKLDADQIARELVVAKAELKKAEEDFLHQIRGVRHAAALAAELNMQSIDRSEKAIERGEKAYAEANDVNRKLAELRSDAAIVSGDRITQAVHDVDEKVAVVDEKVTEIKKRVVEHEGQA